MTEPKTMSEMAELIGYQIYPRSFKDSSGNGIGDLKGITNKLDYLAKLGVNMVWVSPFYTSPMADMGYDVADYCSVDPLFGGMADLEELIEQLHNRNMKLLVDFVSNHTSNQHPWFQEALQGTDSPKRNWYVWSDPKSDGSPPNNWLSIFGGSAWEFDKASGQYYLHTFLKEQPDLNWNNPEVKSAMLDVARFWLGKGVDGFRLDAIPWLSKDPAFRDDPINRNYNPARDKSYDALLHRHSKNFDSFLFERLSAIAEVVAEQPSCFIVAEDYSEDPSQSTELIELYEKVKPDVLAPFNFAAITLPFKAADYKNYLDELHQNLGRQYESVFVLGNHDTSRIVSRVGNEASRMLALMQFTLPGLPFIYYGEELGMEDLNQNNGLEPAHNLNQEFQRDAERTPMQWNAELHAGFSETQPWLPIHSNYPTVNPEAETNDPTSMFNLYRQLIKLRRNSTTLKHGAYAPVESSDPEIFMFMREYEQQKLLIALNFSAEAKPLKEHSGELIISTVNADPDQNTLKPHEGRIQKIS